MFNINITRAGPIYVSPTALTNPPDFNCRHCILRVKFALFKSKSAYQVLWAYNMPVKIEKLCLAPLLTTFPQVL